MRFAAKMAFLYALATTSSVSGCANIQVPSVGVAWQIQADADHYLSNPDTGLGYKTLKAPMNFASLSEEYRVPSRKVSDLTKSCREWAILQAINLSTQTIASKWLCVGGPAQGAGEFGVEDGKGFFKPVKMVNAGVVMSVAAGEFDRAEPIDFSRFTSLDASAVFVTVKRDRMFRRARYDANAGHFESDYPESRNGQDTEFDKAYLHFLEAFDRESSATH